MDAGTINGFLAIWAIAGPVLVGVASALFNRHNQIADRDFNDTRDAVRRAEDRAERLADMKRADDVAGLRWRRETFIEFLSASFDFLYRDGSQQSQEARYGHRTRLARAFATLSILDSEISGEAQALWEACNATLALDEHDVAGFQVAGKQIASARGAFAWKANLIISGHVQG